MFLTLHYRNLGMLTVTEDVCELIGKTLSERRESIDKVNVKQVRLTGHCHQFIDIHVTADTDLLNKNNKNKHKQQEN